MSQPTLPSAEAQQQAAVEVFAQYEPPLYEAYLEMMLEWLAAVKTAMFAGGVVSLGLVPDPLTVFSQTPKWAEMTAKYTEQVAREVLAAPYKDLFADGTLFESRPFVRNWIAARENRLQAVPNEVYGAVAQVIDSATVNGASIPDVTKQVEQLFSDADTPKWKNRARTVARTEVVGAYNGGLYDAFTMIVENDPETDWVKRWLATEDHRTRPDHKEADGQTVPFAQPFDVGGFPMMYPHDPAGPPQETINCRCVMLLEIRDEPTDMGNRQYLAAAARKKRTTKESRMTDLGPVVEVLKKPRAPLGQALPRKHLTACLNPLHPGPCAGSHHKGFLGIGKGKTDESVFLDRYAKASDFREGGKRIGKLPRLEQGHGDSVKLKDGPGYKAVDDYAKKGLDRKINNASREGKMTPELQAQADAIESVMKPTENDILTYRGIRDPREVFGSAWSEKGDNTGLEWKDPGFVSTAQTEQAAMNHTNGGGVMMEIVSAKGTKAIHGPDDARGYDGEPEGEVLLQRGMRFRVVKDIKPFKTGDKHDFSNPWERRDRTLIVEAIPPAAGSSLSASITLMQAVCTDGQFCMETHKPGLCKGQKRGEAEPGAQDATKQTPAVKAQIAVKGLSTALAQAQAVAAQNAASNPKLAAMARKAAAGYSKALRGHQQALKQAAGANARAKATGAQDVRQQDALDRQKANAEKRAELKRETLQKRAQAILARRAEAARVAKMSPKQRAAYGKQKTAQARAKRAAAEAKVLKEAGKG